MLHTATGRAASPDILRINGIPAASSAGLFEEVLHLPPNNSAANIEPAADAEQRSMGDDSELVEELQVVAAAEEAEEAVEGDQRLSRL